VAHEAGVGLRQANQTLEQSHGGTRLVSLIRASLQSVVISQHLCFFKKHLIKQIHL
jgi:hypothetical protein